MAPRANWKGYLKLSLVSCSVALYPATSTSGRVRFNIINRQSGHRVHNQVVDAESGEPVPEDDRVKGYKAKNGRYILLEDEELDRVALESTHTIDIEQFVPRSEVDDIYFDDSYFIAPQDKIGQEAFAVIREAMAKQDVVGLARVVLYRRERVLMLAPHGRGLRATALRYHDEVRDAAPYFDDIPKVKVAPDMLALAAHIIDGKRAHFDPSHFTDRYEKALGGLIKAKGAGKSLPEAPPPAPDNVINLMDALRQSLKRDKTGSGKSPGKAKPARRTSARRAPAASGRRAPARRKKAG